MWGLGVGLKVEQLLDINVQRFRGGLVFKAHRLLHHSTLGLRVIKKKQKFRRSEVHLVWGSGAPQDIESTSSSSSSSVLSSLELSDTQSL